MSRAAGLLLIIAVVACLPRAMLGDWAGTEARRVQIAGEMAAEGSWMVPLIGGEPTFAKPPLHYWLLAVSADLLGDSYLTARLPAVVCLWLLAVLAFGLHRGPFGPGTAWVASLGILCAPAVISQFPTAEIDPVFACLTAGSIWLLAFGVARRQTGALAAAGLLGGLAMLAKGPVYFVFAVGALLVWWRHRRGKGLLAYALPLLCLPAAYYTGLLAIVDWDGLAAVAGEETLGRLSTYRWEHLFDLPAFWLRALLIQLPFVLWCFWEWRSTRDARMGPDDLTLRMCSGAAVFAVVLLSVFPGRPTRYLLPNVPLFVFAVAPAVAHYALRCTTLSRLAVGSLRLIGLAGALGLLATPFLPSPSPLRSPAFMLVCGLVPFVVRTPRQLVAMCLWLPLVAAWTVQVDYQSRWTTGQRGRSPHGSLLVAEMAKFGADESNTTMFGHVHSAVMLGSGLQLPGLEQVQRLPETRFLLREGERWPPYPERPSFVERLRLCIPTETFILEERTGR